MKPFACALFAVLVGCATPASSGVFYSDTQPTTHTKPRHQYHGFSVRPPMDPGWFVTISEQTHERAIYRRHLPTKTHTFLAGVVLGQLDRTLPVEEALVPHGIQNSDRTEALENTHQADTSRKAICIRYSIRFKDKHAPNSPEEVVELIDKGLVCAHPTIPGAFIRASFSERGLEGELDPDLWNGLEYFLGGVQIESAPGVPAA